MNSVFCTCLTSALLVSVMHPAAIACTLTSQLQPEIKFEFGTNPYNAFVKGVVYGGVIKMGSLGDWVC